MVRSADPAVPHVSKNADEHVRPLRYTLAFDVDPSRSRFLGHADIELAVESPTAEVTLNLLDLAIDTCTLTGPDHRSIPVSCEVSADETVRVTAQEKLTAGTGYTLGFAFHGSISGGSGIYLTSGSTDPYAASLFAPIDARRAFPCWDDPAVRAPFTISITTPTAFAALSNGAAVKVTEADGRRRVDFATTPPLPSYLVAVVVGRFDRHQLDGADGPRIGVHIPHGEPRPTFALDTASKTLRFLEQYLGLPYPFDKLDHVAVPSFPGGTESSACIQYNARTLLTAESETGGTARRDALTLIAHETAHMWFGGSVAPDQWGAVWMNEALASVLEYTAAEALMPDSDPWAVFDTGRARALALDAIPSARPVQSTAHSRPEIEGMLDTLTYSKGAALVRMLREHVGDEMFRRSLNQYLRERPFGTATSADLFDAFDRVTGQSIGDLFVPWFTDPGHPRVTVDVSDASVTLACDPRGTVRATPVTVNVSTAGQVIRHALVVAEDSETIPLRQPADWVVVNPSGAGFFRTQYLHDSRPPMHALTPTETVAHLDDHWDAVLRGDLPLEQMFSWLRSGGDSLGVAGLELLTRIARFLRRTQSNDQWSRVVEQLGRIHPAPNRIPVNGLEWDKWTAASIALHTEVLGNEALAIEARSVLRHPDRHLAPAQIAVLARAAVAGTTDKSSWIEVRDLSKSAPAATGLLEALTLAADPDLVRAALDLCLDDEVGADQVPLVIETAISASRTAEPSWGWLVERWPDVRSKIIKYLIPRIVRGIVQCGDAVLAQQADSWLTGGSVGLSETAVAQLREQLAFYTLAAERLRHGGSK
jgi:puromycin-sensitive aminopeptidase